MEYTNLNAAVIFSTKVFFILLLSAERTLQFDFTLIHTNDVHARFEQFDSGTVKCSAGAEAMSECVGGVARRKTAINQIREEADNILFLDGGDQFQGTLWFYLYQGEAAAYFMNKLGYDVMAIGNHEFDLGPDKLADFMKLLKADMVCANIDASREPIHGLFTKSVVKIVGGEQFGIVGYLYERTPEISQTRHVKFLNILEELQREVDVLIEQGVNKIIALGHSGIEKDKEIASKVRGVDIVVGGHTDTFLYTGTPPSTEVPYSDYPIVINPSHNPSGKVLVVQDYTFGKYLGRLDIVFDDEGGITDYVGNPVLLDDSVEEDPELLAEIEEWAESVSNFSDEVIAKSHVFLDGSRETCRLRECNLGNMIADAYLWSLITFPDDEGWNEVSIAIQNGGGVRASILRGDITIGDVSTVLPFGNTVDYMELEGRYVREMLEVSVEEYDPVELPGKLLQTSGMLVTYDISKDPGSRVREVLVRCSECEVPDYEQLDDNKMYKIVMNSFLATGRDGFSVIAERGKNHYTGNMDTAVLSEYLSQHSPIVSGIERRMIIVNGTEDCVSYRDSSSNMVPYFFTVFIASLLSIFIY